MHKFYFLFFSALILFAPSIGKAQDTSIIINDSVAIKLKDSLTLKDIKDSLSTLVHRKSRFEFSLTYLSNNVYLGRKDSIATPYITPQFGYYDKSGLFVNASASYLPTAGESRIDLVTLEAGYAFIAGDFSGLFSASKYWYSSSSYNVRSELKGNISFEASYDFGIIEPTITPALNIGDKLDFALTMGLEHAFYFDDDAFDITPAVNANGGTQNYYNSYYRNRRFSVKRKKVTTIEKGTVSGEVVGAASFKILDYEFTAPLNYTFKKFTFNFSPMYAVPVHPAVVMVTTKIASNPPTTKTKQEQLSNTFFFQAGVTWKF